MTDSADEPPPPCPGTTNGEHCWTPSMVQPAMRDCTFEDCRHCGHRRWVYAQPPKYVYP